MAEIVNADELTIKMDNLNKVLDFNEPLQEACLLVEDTAKRNLTYGNKVDSGTLRNSITHQVVGNVGYVGTNLEYAPYVEYGTGKYAANGEGRLTPWVYWSPETHTSDPTPTHFHVGKKKNGEKYVYWSEETWTPEPQESHFYWTEG